MQIESTLLKIKRKVEPGYFIVDETRFFSDLIVCELEKKFLGKRTADNCSIFDSADLKTDVFLEDLKAISIFSPKRLFIFRDAERLAQDQARKLLDEFKKEVPDHCLVFIAGKKPKHELFSHFKKNGLTLEFRAPFSSKIPFWIDWLTKRESKTMDPKAVPLLMEKVGTDLCLLHKEIEKLCLFIGEKHKIDERDVEKLLYSSRTHSIFDLMTAIGFRKKGEALKILERMIQEGESEIFIFVMILRHLRRLWKAVEWRAIKADTDVQRELAVHPFFWDEFRRQRDFAVQVSFEKYWKEAVEVEHALKTSVTNKRALLARFVATVSG